MFRTYNIWIGWKRNERYYLKNNAGSVLSGGGRAPAPKASAMDWANTVNQIQKGALSSRLGIPMIYGIDAVHGHNNVYNATIFPHNVGLGATRFDFLFFFHPVAQKCYFAFC